MPEVAVVDGRGGREVAMSDVGSLIAKIKARRLAMQFTGLVCEDDCHPFLLWASEPSTGTPPYAHAAGGGAVLAVAAAAAAEEPPSAVRGRAPGALDDAGDLAGELLPDGVDQERGAVAEDDPAVAVRPGGEMERGAGEALGDAVGDDLAVFAGIPQVRDAAEGADLAVPDLDRLGRQQVGVDRLARLRLPGDGRGQQAVVVRHDDDLIVAAGGEHAVQARLAM
jgi:hypothetical protein